MLHSLHCMFPWFIFSLKHCTHQPNWKRNEKLSCGRTPPNTDMSVKGTFDRLQVWNTNTNFKSFRLDVLAIWHNFCCMLLTSNAHWMSTGDASTTHTIELFVLSPFFVFFIISSVRWNCVILVLPVSSVRSLSADLWWAHPPTWPRRFCWTRATTAH